MSGAAFWNKLAEKYAKDPISDQAAYERKLEMTQALFSPETRVLEFGCGTGSTALCHAPHVAEIVATDYSEAMIEIARGKAEGVPNIRFEVASVEDFAAEPESFDVVMGHSLLHLLPESSPFLTKAKSLLKPGGFLVTNTVCFSPWSPIRLAVGAARLIGKAPMVRFSPASAYEADIAAAGFETVERYTPKKMVLFLISRKPA